MLHAFVINHFHNMITYVKSSVKIELLVMELQILEKNMRLKRHKETHLLISKGSKISFKRHNQLLVSIVNVKEVKMAKKTKVMKEAKLMMPKAIISKPRKK